MMEDVIDPPRRAWFGGGGTSLRTLRAGDGPASLVFIHELGGSAESWAGVAGALGSSWSWLAYDQRGHGDSEKPPGPLDMATHADDLERLLDAHDVERPCWLVAAAAGAAIAAEYALRRPERVAGIVMCAPSLDAPVARRQALRDRADLAAREGMRAIVDEALGRSWPPVLRSDDESRARFATYRSRMLGNDPAAYAHAARAFVGVALGDRLAELSCACLVLAGAHDLQRPPDALRASTGAMPDVTFETLPAGHLMAVQAPVMVAARIAAFVPGAHP